MSKKTTPFILQEDNSIYSIHTRVRQVRQPRSCQGAPQPHPRSPSSPSGYLPPHVESRPPSGFRRDGRVPAPSCPRRQTRPGPPHRRIPQTFPARAPLQRPGDLLFPLGCGNPRWMERDRSESAHVPNPVPSPAGWEPTDGHTPFPTPGGYPPTRERGLMGQESRPSTPLC